MKKAVWLSYISNFALKGGEKKLTQILIGGAMATRGKGIGRGKSQNHHHEKLLISLGNISLLGILGLKKGNSRGRVYPITNVAGLLTCPTEWRFLLGKLGS